MRTSLVRAQALHGISRPTLRTPKLRLHFSSMADVVRPNICQGEDEGQLMTQTIDLLKSKWSLDDTRQGLEKTFNFPTYSKALVKLSMPCRLLTDIDAGLHIARWGGNKTAKSPPYP